MKTKLEPRYMHKHNLFCPLLSKYFALFLELSAFFGCVHNFPVHIRNRKPGHKP